ncbi:CDP-alcohol phosphatidyltransferase family protein [Candidatus Woesearchaeota archaeon]|jgi:phosphatidylglycerophosphate synthase|nr:CDP-alcohol phosphatidyltransferase family protein [Candidatus Woesearchaeota archaeon]MBT4110572.1 CDP-alcohol phosphatidyltransferase family protein [Candidatus Woesearchaeota archaeon]MBT4335904.1 CDP-alcohol phosphatidyltransferase family protein [Candidatus Woesearchaeota archaeon]MBT4469117.1 CDP-alcohol phosphatidyltransferase family protein [Candidatus Woesearchaeota archaeon]MBT6744564.1 CDP-alcohol phosphatidyltransferase family protein [Candidatus Woesearchaeota archaeon]
MKTKYPFKTITKTEEQLHSWTYVFLLKYPTILLTWLFANFTNFSPNLVSFLGLIPSFISAYFYVNGNLLFGALFYLLAWLLDGVDGRLARVKSLGSKYGAFYDNYVGQIGFIIMIMGFFYGIARIKQNSLWLLLGILVYFLVTFRSLIALKVKTLMGNEYRVNLDEVNVEEASIKETKGLWGLAVRLQNKLNQKGLVEPFNLIDMIVLIFIIGPIAELILSGSLIYVIIFALIMIIIKEIIWFLYYRKILKDR